MATPISLSTKITEYGRGNLSRPQSEESFHNSLEEVSPDQTLMNNSLVDSNHFTPLVTGLPTDKTVFSGEEKQINSQSKETISDNPVPTKKDGFLSNLFKKIKSLVSLCKKEPWLALGVSIGVVGTIVTSIISAGVIPATIAAVASLYSLAGIQLGCAIKGFYNAFVKKNTSPSQLPQNKV